MPHLRNNLYSVSLTFVASTVPEVLNICRAKIEATSNHRFYGPQKVENDAKERK